MGFKEFWTETNLKLDSRFVPGRDGLVGISFALIPLFLILLLHFALPETEIINPPADSIIDILGGIGAALLGLHLSFSMAAYRTNSFYRAAVYSFASVAILRFCKSVTEEAQVNFWFDTLIILYGGLPFLLAAIIPKVEPTAALKNLGRFFIALTAVSAVFVFLFADHFPGGVQGENYGWASVLFRVLGDTGYIIVALRLLLSRQHRIRFEYLILGTYCLFLACAHILLPFVHVWSAQWWLLELFRPFPYYVALFFLYPHYLRSHEEMREREERFRLLFESSPVGLAIIGRHYNFIQVNQALCRIFGMTQEELLKQNFLSLTHPDDLRETIRYGERFFSGDIDRYQIEKRYFRRDGKLTYISKTVDIFPGTRKKGSPLAIAALLEISPEVYYAHKAVQFPPAAPRDVTSAPPPATA